MRLLIFFLLLSLGADAQIIRANPFYVPQPSGITYLLDAYPNAAAAYSLRKLKSSYSGSAIRIRRDSTGNAETDIGFTANGDLDTNAIKTHCRNNSCMVTTWYNQGDSTANATQITAANQPRIVLNGIIERQNGKPAIRFDSTNDRLGTSYILTYPLSIFATVKKLNISTTSIGSIVGNARITSMALGTWAFGIDNSNLIYRGSGITDAIIKDTNSLFLGFARRVGNIGYVAINGSNLNSSGTLNSTQYNVAISIGGASTATSPPRLWYGFISELILYNSDQNTNRTGIETNINNYYGLW